MAKKWVEVAASPEFNALEPQQQEEARQQYWREVVAPNVPQDQLQAVQSEFDADTKPTIANPNAEPLVIDIVGGQSMPAGDYAQMRQQEGAPDPTEGMSGFDKFMAGMGRSVVETGRGLRQVGSAVADAIPGVDLTDYRKNLQSEIDEARKLDAPLLATGAGALGNAAGYGVQTLVPGGLIGRASMVGRALLPSTIAGNAALGAALGGIEPVATGESRLSNLLAGGAGGAIGAGAGKVIGKAATGARNMLRPSASGIDRAAADILRREAEDVAKIMRPQPSQVPGVQRTLAEESLDPGIARLERNSRSTTNIFDPIDRSNNAARVNVLDALAGTDADMARAVARRDSLTSALRDKAFAEGDAAAQAAQQMRALNLPVDSGKKALQLKIKSISGENSGRPSVQSALNDVSRALSNSSDSVGGLYSVRQYIGDLLNGIAGSGKSYAQAATRELMQVRDVLDDEISRRAPSFSKYLLAYQKASKPINRMEVGRELLAIDSGSAILDPVTGKQVLTPAQFSKKSRDLDAVAHKAAGFAKAKAEDILRPGDIANIKAIQDDLERQAFRATAGSGGNSQTFERQALDKRLANRAVGAAAGKIPFVGRYIQDFAEALDKSKNDRLKERIAYLLANPSEARRVMAALPQAGRDIVSKALAQVGGAAGSASAVTASSQDQPLEVDFQIAPDGSLVPQPSRNP